MKSNKTLNKKKGAKKNNKKKTEAHSDIDYALLNIISPLSFEVRRDSFGLGDVFGKYLGIIKYPEKLEYGWLGKILNIPNTMASVSFNPINSSEFIQALSINTARQEFIAQTTVSPLERSRAQVSAKNSEETMRQIDSNNEPIGYISLNLMKFGDERSIDLNARNVASACSYAKLRTRALVSLQKDSYQQNSPAYGINDKVERVTGRITLLSTLLGGFPFSANGFNDNQGYILGKDSNQGLVIIDPWLRHNDRTNSNMIITGIAGTGKSTAIKLIAVNELMNGTKIIFIDPEREYKDLTLNLGGTWLNIGGGKNKINPLEIRPIPDADENEDEDLYLDDEKQAFFKEEIKGLGEKALHMKTLEVFLDIYLKNLDEEHKAILKRTIIELYDNFGIGWETSVKDFRPEDFPTFLDLYKLLLQKVDNEKDELQGVYKKLSILLEDIAIGADSHVWAGATNISRDSNLICLDTNDLQEAPAHIKSAQYFNALSWAWQQMSKDRSEKVLLICDEGYLMADKNVPLTLLYLRNIVKRNRKYESGLIFATHSIVDLLDPSIKMYGQSLLDIPSIKLLFGTDGENLKEQKTLFKLTDAEEEFLEGKVRGQSLLLVGAKRLKCSIEVSDSKLKIFGKAGGR